MHNAQDVQIGQRLIALGMLQQAQAYHCLQLATQQRRAFLTIAVEIGYLTLAQASALHNQQGSLASTASGSQHLRGSESKTTPLDRSKLQKQLHGSTEQSQSSPPVNDSQVPFRSNSRPEAPAPLSPDSDPSSSTFHPRARPSNSSFSGEGMLPAPGDVIDGYEIQSLLGRGGMGAVFLANKSGASYALKVITTANTSALTRFEREAQAVAKVDSHPNIVSIHSYSKRLEVPFIVMDFVSGKGLDTLIDDPTMTIERSLDIVATVAEALAFVHQRGVLHRDLKPANILIRESDQAPMVTDFGLAKQYDAEVLTRSTDVLGTPHYMSPEQAGSEHDQVDESTDVWALGVILYELVTKTKPFEGQTMLQIARSIMFAPVTIPPESLKALPQDLETVILTALEKHKSDRYQDATAFAKDCRAVASGDPISASRLTWLQLKSRGLRRALTGPKIIIALVLLAALLCAPGVAYFYYIQKQSSDEFSSRIEKIATPYSERIRKFNKALNTALAQKMAVTMKRAEAAPLWDALTKDLADDYSRLEKLRTLAYESDPSAFDRVVDPKSWARIQGTQAIIEAFQANNEKTLITRFPKIRPTDEKLATAIVAMQLGQRDQAIKLFAQLDSKSGTTGRVSRFALALFALEKNDFEDGLGRLEQLRAVEGFAKPAVDVLFREWPKAFVYTAFMKDESSLRTNLTTVLDQLRDFAKTIPNPKLFWQNVNNEINARFLVDGALKDRRRRIARVFEALKEKSLVVSEIQCPRLTRSLHLALARRIETRYDDKFPSEMRKALFHHLSIQKLDESYELPERYKRVLSGLAMGSMMESHREAYNDVLVVTRAGIYLPYIRTFVLSQFERNNLLDGPVAQNPADFAARFWRGMISVPSKSQKRELGIKRLKNRIERSLADLSFVIEHSDTPPIFRALALLQRADMRIERTLLDRLISGANLDQALFDSLTKDCQDALKNWHPEPDRVYELLMRLESRYKVMKESKVRPSTTKQIEYAELWVSSIEDRQRRSESQSLGKGRPKESPLADMVGYRNKLRSAFTSLSRAYQTESKFERAAKAAQSAINCALKSDEKGQMFECLYELIESYLKLGEVEKAQSAYREYYLNNRHRSDYSKREIASLEELWRAAKQQVPGKNP